MRYWIQIGKDNILITEMKEIWKSQNKYTGIIKKLQKHKRAYKIIGNRTSE